MLLGEAQSKCEHIKGVPMEPHKAQRLYTLFLTKGVQGTTAIEGNTLSEAQVLEVVEGKDLDLPASQEYLETEVRNIVEACNRLWKEIELEPVVDLTPEMIKGFNFQILADLELQDGVIPGEIRTGTAVVGNVYKGPPAEDCDYLLARLCDWLNGPSFASSGPEVRAPLAIIRAVMAHLYLAWIHPFGDGNGRTARLVEVQILSAAGFPKPAAHLLSNHYNQTRALYYRQLQLASRAERGELGFLQYAVEGLVDGLHAQLKMIREQQMEVAWIYHVHSAFTDDKSLVTRRRRKLVLNLSDHVIPVPKAQLRGLSADVALAYADLTDRALNRDLKELIDMGLVRREGKGYLANKEVILAFLPATAPGHEIAIEMASTAQDPEVLDQIDDAHLRQRAS